MNQELVKKVSRDLSVGDVVEILDVLVCQPSDCWIDTKWGVLLCRDYMEVLFRVYSLMNGGI